MFSSSQMCHGLLGDISMVAPVPRRDAFLVAKDRSAPPKLSDTSTLTPPPPRSDSAKKRLNQLERSCIIGVPAGATPAPEEEPEGANKDPAIAPVWMGSGFVERRHAAELDAPPQMGDGTGDGHEERSVLQPWFFNTDSHLLERRRVQSTVQCFSRVLRDHNRKKRDKERGGFRTHSALDKAVDSEPNSTFVKPHQLATSPLLGKGKEGGSQLITSYSRASDPSLARSQSACEESSQRDPEGQQGASTVFVRHFGHRKDPTGTRDWANWKNEETGIFPGAGHTQGNISTLTKGNKAREHTSLQHLLRDKITHQRSNIPLPEKYNKPVTSAQEVGWDLRDAEWHDHQQFPRMRCYFTAYDQRLKDGGIQDQLVMRRLGMKC